MKKINAVVGDAVQPDEWQLWGTLEKDSHPFSDSSFSGCQFRLPCKDCKLAVNIETTGKPKWNGRTWKSRCKIEFVGDGEPSEFSGGVVFHNESLKNK